MFVDSEQQKLCICELHNGVEVECKKATKMKEFKPMSLVLDEFDNIKVIKFT